MITKHLLPLAITWLVLTGSLPAQVEISTVDDDASQRIYRFQVTPSAVPKPAFKYRLTVPPHQQIPGNAITHILRSFGENSLDHPLEQYYKQFGYEFDIDKLNAEQLKEASSLFDHYVDHHLRRAARCREIDWGLNEEGLSGIEAVEFLLPSIQQTRNISRVLNLRTRNFVAQKDFQQAIDQIRMNYRLGECSGKMKFLVSSLVGIAEVGITNGSVVDFIAAEDSPNLYWALRELPDPIVNPREAIRLEMSLAERMIPELKDPLNANHTPEEWAKIYREAIDQVIEMQRYTGGGSNSGVPASVQPLLAVGASAIAYPGAKQRLIDSGLDAKRVESMSVGQVLMIDAANDYRQFSNQVEASFYLGNKFDQLGGEPYRQISAATGQMRLGAIIADYTLPATEQVNQAYFRVRRDVAALITIEALRNHLAVHGSAPNSLGELELPAPLNPMTGQPFEYQKMDGGTMVLNLPKSDGTYLGSRYEITMRKE